MALLSAVVFGIAMLLTLLFILAYLKATFYLIKDKKIEHSVWDSFINFAVPAIIFWSWLYYLSH